MSKKTLFYFLRQLNKERVFVEGLLLQVGVNTGLSELSVSCMNNCVLHDGFENEKYLDIGGKNNT